MTRKQRLYLRLALLLALVAGQQIALVHGVSHLSQPAAASGDGKSLPHAGACGVCILCAHLAAALPSSKAIAPLVLLSLAVRAWVAAGASSSQLLAFRSRAPPARL